MPIITRCIVDKPYFKVLNIVPNDNASGHVIRDFFENYILEPCNMK